MTKPNPSGNTVHTPPHLIENVVRLLTPRIRRRDLLDELREDFETKPQSSRYVGQSARTLARLIPGTALTAFNAALVMAQAAVLVMSFAGATLSVALAFGIGIGLLVLVVRDGHTYPSEDPFEAILDSGVAAIFVILSAILVAMVARVPILPFPIMVRGGIASLLSLSLLRMIFRRPDYNKEYSPKELSNQWYLMACRVNIIWLIAYLLFSLTNADSNDFHWAARFFGSAPMLIIGLSFKSRWQGMSRPKKDDVAISIRADHDKMELQRKLSLLWIPKTLTAEVLFFGIVAMQCVVSIIASPADWILHGTNVTASFMLLVVWRYIRRANRTAAQLIQTEIDKLEVKV